MMLRIAERGGGDDCYRVGVRTWAEGELNYYFFLSMYISRAQCWY